MRTEGLTLWTLFETELQNRRMPTEELLEAILFLMSGIVLLIPGLITDSIGFALLVPLSREWMIIRIRQYLSKKISL